MINIALKKTVMCAIINGRWVMEATLGLISLDHKETISHMSLRETGVQHLNYFSALHH